MLNTSGHIEPPPPKHKFVGFFGLFLFFNFGVKVSKIQSWMVVNCIFRENTHLGHDPREV